MPGMTGVSQRTLYLLRHAKSSWEDAALPDENRPLAERGRRATKKLACYVRNAGVAPTLVLCSPSVRTRETLAGIRGALGEPEVCFPDELYAASEATILGAVQGVGPDVRSLLVVGHNPGLQGLAAGLAGTGNEDARRRLREKLPTGALVTLALHVGTWADLEPGSCELVDYVVPREL